MCRNFACPVLRGGDCHNPTSLPDVRELSLRGTRQWVVNDTGQLRFFWRGAEALNDSGRTDMRTVIIGAVAGACFCVLVVAGLGTIAGYSDPDGFPPGLMPGVPRTVVG